MVFIHSTTALGAQLADTTAKASERLKQIATELVETQDPEGAQAAMSEWLNDSISDQRTLMMQMLATMGAIAIRAGYSEFAVGPGVEWAD